MLDPGLPPEQLLAPARGCTPRQRDYSLSNAMNKIDCNLADGEYAFVTVKQRKQRAYPFVSSFTLRSRCEELSICVPTILEMCVLFLGGKNQFYRLALPYVPAMLLSAH